MYLPSYTCPLYSLLSSVSRCFYAILTLSHTISLHSTLNHSRTHTLSSILSLPLSIPFQISDDAAFAYFYRHLVAMLNKRRLYFMRDTRSWIFQYVVPGLFVLVGMLIMRVSTARCFYGIHVMYKRF